MLDVSGYSPLLIVLLVALALLVAPVVLYAVVWIASRAFHDARYNAVAKYSRGLARRQTKREQGK